MPHPFRWVPADGQRHASQDRCAGLAYQTGVVVETLCGHQLAADNSTLAWFWATCPACNAKARKLAGVDR